MIHKKKENIRLDEEKKKLSNGQYFPSLIIFIILVISLKYSLSEIIFSCHFVVSSLICTEILYFEI